MPQVNQVVKLEGGLRTKGLFAKRPEPSRPLLSIITVCLNAEKHLEQTLQSVLSQSYDNIEYIIIDGGSKDNTLNIIRNYENRIAYWVSEPDRGIYNAMNKGILSCTGEIVYFLNADDYLYDEKVIETVVNYFVENSLKVVFGNIVVVDPSDNFRLELGKETTIKEIKKGIMAPHQGTFMRKEVLIDNNLFDEEYKIAADFELLVKCFIKGYKSLYIDKIIALFRLTGASSKLQGAVLAIAEVRTIIRKHFDLITYVRYLIRSQLILLRLTVITKLGLTKYWRKFKMMIKGT